ncbi:Coactivator CBP, KIX domain [Phytophthora cactorum]|nr:Coactivator CBP, KIX domain [Phytophthora cactorum]
MSNSPNGGSGGALPFSVGTPTGVQSLGDDPFATMPGGGDNDFSFGDSPKPSPHTQSQKPGDNAAPTSAAVSAPTSSAPPTSSAGEMAANYFGSELEASGRPRRPPPAPRRAVTTDASSSADDKAKMNAKNETDSQTKKEPQHRPPTSSNSSSSSASTSAPSTTSSARPHIGNQQQQQQQMQMQQQQSVRQPDDDEPTERPVAAVRWPTVSTAIARGSDAWRLSGAPPTSAAGQYMGGQPGQAYRPPTSSYEEEFARVKAMMMQHPDLIPPPMEYGNPNMMMGNPQQNAQQAGMMNAARLRAAQMAQQQAQQRAAAGRTPSGSNDTQTAWQSENDLPLRRKMIGKIVSLLQQRKPDAPAEWIRRLPDMARRLEDSLYRTAKNRDEYGDFSSLKTRLQHLAVTMGARAQHKAGGNPRAAGAGAVPGSATATAGNAAMMAGNAPPGMAMNQGAGGMPQGHVRNGAANGGASQQRMSGDMSLGESSDFLNLDLSSSLLGSDDLQGDGSSNLSGGDAMKNGSSDSAHLTGQKRTLSQSQQQMAAAANAAAFKRTKVGAAGQAGSQSGAAPNQQHPGAATSGPQASQPSQKPVTSSSGSSKTPPMSTVNAK